MICMAVTIQSLKYDLITNSKIFESYIYIREKQNRNLNFPKIVALLHSSCHSAQ